MKIQDNVVGRVCTLRYDRNAKTVISDDERTQETFNLRVEDEISSLMRSGERVSFASLFALVIYSSSRHDYYQSQPLLCELSTRKSGLESRHFDDHLAQHCSTCFQPKLFVQLRADNEQ